MKFQSVAELVQAIVNLKIELKQEKSSKKLTIQNLKAVTYQESVEFLKGKSRILTEMLTKYHKKIVQQFIDYKKQTNWKIKDFEDNE